MAHRDHGRRRRAGLLRNVQIPVVEFLMTDEQSPAALAAGIREVKPSVVVALGGRALNFCKKRLADVPVLAGLVVRSQLEAAGDRKTVGVALETSAATEFSLYRAVIPTLTRVVTFYSPERSARTMAVAADELGKIGVTLVAVPVNTPEELLKAYQEHGGSEQAVWLVSDSILLNIRTCSKRYAASRPPRTSLCFVPRCASMPLPERSWPSISTLPMWALSWPRWPRASSTARDWPMWACAHRLGVN
jgi:hypothetical protein